MTSQALSVSLIDAAACVQAVGTGRSLTAALEDVPASRRPTAQALAFQVMRRWGQARALRGQLTKPSTAPALAGLLDVALVLLQADDADDATDDHRHREPHTVVSQAVEAAKSQPALRHAAPMVNAVLRRALREPGLGALTTLEAQWNHPAWWVRALQKDWPQTDGDAKPLWQAILAANQQRGPMTLRVNPLRASREAYAAALAAEGIASTPVAAHGLQLQSPVAVARLPGFAAGDCSVQDAHAQLAAPLLLDGLPPPIGRPWRVLDACAAPGGKTTHLLEWLGSQPPGSMGMCPTVELTAIDKDETRLARVADSLRRLNLTAKLAPADAAAPEKWWDGEPFDAILLDAPCTASGIVRRHPDVRWLRRPADIAQLAAEQKRLLDALWPLVRSGGRLLYCTCSVFKAEGEHQAKAFVSRHTDALVLPSPGHLLPGSIMFSGKKATVGPKINGDGFFYALFERR